MAQTSPELELFVREALLRGQSRDAIRQALVVSHQLPIFIARRDVEGRSFVHDPRARQTTLCSVTSFTVRDGRITAVEYAEPAADLLPVKKGRGFKVGT